MIDWITLIDWAIKIVGPLVVIILFYLTTRSKKSDTDREQGKWEGSVDEKLKGLDKRVGGLDNRIDQLHSAFDRLTSKISYSLRRDDALTDSRSPLSLTKLGKQVANKIKAEDEADKHIDSLRQRTTDNGQATLSSPRNLLGLLRRRVCA